MRGVSGFSLFARPLVGGVPEKLFLRTPCFVYSPQSVVVAVRGREIVLPSLTDSDTPTPPFEPLVADRPDLFLRQPPNLSRIRRSNTSLFLIETLVAATILGSLSETSNPLCRHNSKPIQTEEPT